MKETQDPLHYYNMIVQRDILILSIGCLNKKLEDGRRDVWHPRDLAASVIGGRRHSAVDPGKLEDLFPTRSIGAHEVSFGLGSAGTQCSCGTYRGQQVLLCAYIDGEVFVISQKLFRLV